MVGEFSWDGNKNENNKRKHGADFREAATVFADEHAVLEEDELHSLGEQRTIIIGRSDQDRLLFAVFVETTETIRIVTARPAEHQERRKYEQG